MRRFRPSLFAGALVFVLLIHVQGCALLIAGGVAGGAAGGATAAKDSRREEHSAGTYAGTVLANVLYVPAKAVFAGVGAVTSGVTYLVTLGNPTPTASVWNSTVNGDYVLTPNMIEGKEPVHFVG